MYSSFSYGSLSMMLKLSILYFPYVRIRAISSSSPLSTNFMLSNWNVTWCDCWTTTDSCLSSSFSRRSSAFRIRSNDPCTCSFSFSENALFLLQSMSAGASTKIRAGQILQTKTTLSKVE
uniref:(northern house mosquito) hypothetical protein n=1 Tax=Culex pipiens TaxID=7175 RepID=A0A8D8NY48_CULPI